MSKAKRHTLWTFFNRKFHFNYGNKYTQRQMCYLPFFGQLFKFEINYEFDLQLCLFVKTK